MTHVREEFILGAAGAFQFSICTVEFRRAFGDALFQFGIEPLKARLDPTPLGLQSGHSYPSR